MEDLEKQTFAGVFTLSPGRKVRGELVLAGTQSSLDLWDDNFIGYEQDEEHLGYVKFIKGVSNDLKKVSLINCWDLGSGGVDRLFPEEDTIHNARFLPDYAVFGNDHISPDEKTIIKTSIVIEDEAAFFNDPNAFGVVRTPSQSLVKQVVRSNPLSRNTEAGENPVIAYYRGDSEIFTAHPDTALDTVSGWRRIRHGGSREGARIEGEVSVNLEFAAAVAFEDAIDESFKVLCFLELLAGRPQNLMDFKIYKESGHETPYVLQVYGSFFSKYERRENDRRPSSPNDVLIDAVENPEEFSSVLEHWLKEYDAWREPHRRFFNGFLKQGYSIDRLLTVANAFEVLPVGAIPPEKEPSEDLQTALDCCKKKLGVFLEEPDRNSVFSAFGRVGKSSLKKKVRHRARVITDEIEDRLPEFSYVASEAVNCRNHYVHGAPYGIDYEKESIWGFLLETLEFVFAVSCLIDAGWKIRTRYERDGGLRNHPFDEYITNYEGTLRRLKRLKAK